MAQKKQVIAVAVLGVLLLGVVVFQFSRGDPPPPATEKADGKAAAAAPAAKSAQGTASAGKSPVSPTPAAAKPSAAAGAGRTAIKQADVDIDTLLSGIKEVDFDYDKDRQARDPMAPLVGKVANLIMENQNAQNVPPATVGQVLNKVVTGIVWDPKTPVAVVDNDVVYPGFEYADGTTVVSIERDRVVFKVGDSPIEVKLKEL